VACRKTIWIRAGAIGGLALHSISVTGMMTTQGVEVAGEAEVAGEVEVGLPVS
jgi:hypothetical protein